MTATPPAPAVPVPPAGAAGPQRPAQAEGEAPAPAVPRRKRRPKDIGTAAETAVVRHLQANGFPHAERRALRGTYDCGDVTGTPAICWEIKGGQAAKTASDGQIAAWLAETETERVNARADIGVLVVQRAGIGAGNAGRWWAIIPDWQVMRLAGVEGAGSNHPYRLHLADVAHALRLAGYGEPLDGAA